VVSDAVNFRRERIPCDVIGLEPGWMEKNYDGSTTKQWSNDRFPIPRYALTGPHNFFNALNRMGFHMELWLCCDYDLSFEAERRIGNPTPGRLADDNSAFFHPDGELDEHFSTPRFLDSVTKPDEPWFEHLKAFVDQGADFFKQDGAYQVLDHPDRRWGNGMSDREMHNLYPLLYARQMLEGFEEHTGRRGLTFTPCGWTGFQAWAGTWTGDTGGGPKTIGAMLNTAVVGHSWATNDMEVTQKEALHFGYLLPWAQINSWNYFRMPWIQGDELLEAHRTYSQFRARLIPYIYSWAYHATQTGFPLIAPLTLDFQDDPACKDILLQFLLGRDLMVCAFTDEAYFPEGMWYDMWSGELVDGRQRRNITWPADRGGGLFLRRGGIVPFGPVMQYRGERPVDAIDVLAFPGPKPSHFALYEDDGVSLAHRDGACAVTTIMTVGSDTSAELSVDSPAGCLQVVCPNRTWTARLVVPKEPVAVILDGKAVPVDRWSYDAALRTVAVADVQPPCKVTVRWE
jgi:alpha-glucosidase (family GH31 glycosyl hydrolase)